MTKLHQTVDPSLIHTWAKGWAKARALAPPTTEYTAFRVDVGWPDQKTRYIFPEANNSYREFAQTIEEPYVFLKACATAETVAPLLSEKWKLEDSTNMMVHESGNRMQAPPLPLGYKLVISNTGPVPLAEIIYQETVVAKGGIALVNDYGIYDRISTDAAHRRKGLASVIMGALQDIGHQHNIRKGILVASHEGQFLYEKLGWKFYAPYSTAVILPA
ncbi:N-acetyltransferase [Chitinophaga silvatica]|uniref:N-acetyltransferase n=1 Tax=Chitinophaga silvatica TaxID=2282649 RepID=A0A3E1YGP0_9BACT|nr:GNAT family N-acetyltransferase [Chitinophaga silvatica]RFS26370.1 N-acetyltransferase [Chitinophaga silvatica]